MSTLQLSFLLDFVLAFIVVLSISNLALGRGGIWAVGHLVLMGSGGVYAYAARVMPAPLAIVVALGVLMLASVLLSLAAALLEGDRFVVVSLAVAYASNALLAALFGEGVRDVPGATDLVGKEMVLLGSAVMAGILVVYVQGIERGTVGTVLSIARDDASVIESAGVRASSLRFWTYLVSALPVGVAGILVTVFHGTYSPAFHSMTRCLLLFTVAFPFGVGAVAGSATAAVFYASLRRGTDIVMSSATMNALYRSLSGGSSFETASNTSESIVQCVLALALIVFVRVRPEGLFGKEGKWVRQ